MKATLRNGKGSAAHNDRSYKTATHEEKEEVIAKGQAISHARTFEENELRAYEVLFSDWLNERNERYKKKGQYDRIKEMKDVIGGTNLSKTKTRYEPTETLLQIGKNGEEVNIELLKLCFSEFIKEITRRYGRNMQILDFAIHLEKSSVAHVHLRRVWFAYDENGNKYPCKKAALKELGFNTENSDRYNNATILQTEEERQIWYDICQTHGLNIDRIADVDNAEHMQTKEYKRIKTAQNQAISDRNEIINRQNKKIAKNKAEIEKTEQQKKELGIAFDTRSLDDIINIFR